MLFLFLTKKTDEIMHVIGWGIPQKHNSSFSSPIIWNLLQHRAIRALMLVSPEGYWPFPRPIFLPVLGYCRHFHV